MNNGNKVLITLTPVGKYFFGGEVRFATGNEKHDKQFASYIVRSEIMPQQTSLLGMLRFLLLSNEHELFDEDANHIRTGMAGKVSQLIGESGFRVKKERLPEAGNAGGAKLEKAVSGKSAGNDYGWIQSVSPCFLYHKKSGQAFFRSVMNEEMKLDFGASVKGYINREERSIPSIWVKKVEEKKGEKWELYTGKDTLKRIWMSADGNFVKETDLFKEDVRIGIDKSVDGKRKDSAFYKQISYRLEEEYCLALIAEINLGAGRTWKDYDGQVVTLGADSSAFVLHAYPQMKEMPQALPDKSLYEGEEGKVRMMLLSDAYIPEESILERVLFAISDVRPFRFLQTTNSEEARKYNVAYNLLQSVKRYDLYRAGSVFFFHTDGEAEAFGEKLRSVAEFYQIGYNHYCKLVKK